MALIKVSLLSQEVTWELNEKSSHGTANSSKYYNNKHQQEKLENQILYVRKSHHQKYEESRLQKSRSLVQRCDTVENYSSSHKWPKDIVLIVSRLYDLKS